MSALAWITDYDAALARVRARRGLVLVHFWLQGRPMCQAMEQDTLSRPEVATAAAGLTLVKIEIDRRPELFEKLIGGRGGLATCIVDGSEDVVSAQLGYVGLDDFVLFLTTAARGYPRLKEARARSDRRPRDPGALLSLAEAYDALGSPRRSEECFTRILALAPVPGPAGARVAALSHERLARFAVLRGRNQEVRQHLAEYRRLAGAADPGGCADRAALTEGLVLAVERRMTEAVRALEAAVKAYPASGENDHMLFALGAAQHELKDDTRALSTLQSLLARHPGSRWRAPALQQIAHIKNPTLDHQH